MIVFMHFIREYGKSGFKVRMCNKYCSVKEVLSSLYIVSHWVCTAIVITLLIIDYKIDGNYAYDWYEDWESIITHRPKLAFWLYPSIVIYFLAGLYNTKLAIELFRDRGRVPDFDPAFALPDYIGQNMNWY